MLNRHALDKLYEARLKGSCAAEGAADAGAGDVALSDCLRGIGASPPDTRDAAGAVRRRAFDWHRLMLPA